MRLGGCGVRLAKVVLLVSVLALAGCGGLRRVDRAKTEGMVQEQARRDSLGVHQRVYHSAEVVGWEDLSYELEIAPCVDSLGRPQALAYHRWRDGQGEHMVVKGGGLRLRQVHRQEVQQQRSEAAALEGVQVQQQRSGVALIRQEQQEREVRKRGVWRWWVVGIGVLVLLWLIKKIKEWKKYL